MILDHLREAHRYTALHPAFARAFQWCANPDLSSMPDSRQELDGERLIVIVESGMTQPAHQRRFESHRRYIDIQVNLCGPELMEWIPVNALRVEDDFRPDNDIAFYRQPSGGATRLIVAPDHFAIFWPEDAHKPVCTPGSSPVAYRKLVFKVALDGQGSFLKT
jgi:biofilm protein TabA